MYRDSLEEPLAKLGLTPKNFHALRVLPLLYVAWANGEISEIEREQILSMARDRLELDSEAMQLVHHWLSAPPTKQLVRGGIECLKKAALAVDQPDLGTDDLLRMLWEAESMTRKAAILTGKPYEPSEQQHEALLELAHLMDLDTGVPWLELLTDLGGKSEAEETLPRQAQLPTAATETRPREHERQDRLRRWRTAFRLHTSHNHRVAPGGGLI